MSDSPTNLQVTVDFPQLRHGWSYKSVSELGAIGEQAVLTGPFGTTLGRGDFVSSGVPLLTIGCLTEGGILLDKALFVTEAKANELARYRLKEGDLLFSRMASVGRAGLVPKSLEGALFNYHIMRLRLDTSSIEPRVFINYVRGAQQVRKYLKEVNHGATRDGINTEQLLQMPVAVPPLSEQSGIVAEIEKQFSRLDEAVTGLKRVKANLKRYKAAILKAAVEGRLVPTEADLARREGRNYETGAQLLQRILETRRSQWQGKGKYIEPAAPNTTDVPELLEGWAWATLDQLTTKIADVDHKMPKAVDGGIPYVSTKDFYGDEAINFNGAKRIAVVDYESLCRKIKPEFGDVLLSRYGTVGEVRLVSTNDAFQASYSIAILKRIREIDTVEFLIVTLRSEVVQQQIKRDVRATAQPDLGLTHIRLFQVPVPPLAEQHRIVAEVDRLLSIAREVEAEVETNLKRAQALRGGILQHAFSV